MRSIAVLGFARATADSVVVLNINPENWVLTSSQVSKNNSLMTVLGFSGISTFAIDLVYVYLSKRALVFPTILGR